MILVGYFFWYALRRAVINDARIAQGLPSLEELEPDKTLTWPDLVYTELICMVILTIVLVVWGIVLQAPLEQPASSTVAPNPSKAPWYFLGLQEMLVYFDPWMAGVVLAEHDHRRPDGDSLYRYQQGGQRLFLVQRPQVRLPHVPVRVRRALGRLDPPGYVPARAELELLRPYEFWDLHKVIPLNNVQSLGYFLDPASGDGQARAIILREAPGILLTLGYFTIVPFLLYRLFFKKYTAQAGVVRYVTLAILILFMASLPLKMVLRWTINLKYVVAIPEYFFNI